MGRKILANDGEVLRGLLDDIQLTADSLKASEQMAGLAPALQNAVNAGHTACQWLLDNAGNDRNVAGSVGVNLL